MTLLHLKKKAKGQNRVLLFNEASNILLVLELDKPKNSGHRLVLGDFDYFNANEWHSGASLEEMSASTGKLNPSWQVVDFWQD